jgi:hypothetical protein
MIAARTKGSLAYPHQRATPAQRTRIRSQLILLELPTDRITLLHRDAFVSACIAFPPPGTVLDDALYALTSTQASALIDVLRSELEDLS